VVHFFFISLEGVVVYRHMYFLVKQPKYICGVIDDERRFHLHLVLIFQSIEIFFTRFATFPLVMSSISTLFDVC